MTIEIWKPLMQAHTGKRKISLAVHKIMQEGDVVKVQVTYKRKDGSPLHPYPFLISKVKALQYPRTTIDGVTCVTIPLHEFKEDVPNVQQPLNYPKPKFGMPPARPCWNCQGTRFWKTKWGAWLCCLCHPNPNPEVNTEEIDVSNEKIETPTHQQA